MNHDEQYRIMFVIRVPSELQLLTIVGTDYWNGSLFVCKLHSPNDSIDLNYNTSHFPKDLLNHIGKEKELIDRGFYDLQTYEISLFEKKIKAQKEFKMKNIKDRGLAKKWAPFQSLPDQWKGVRKVFQDDNKIAKPILDEDELEVINNHIMESLEMEKPIMFKLYENQGYVKSEPGVVSKVDPFQKMIKIIDAEGSLKSISFKQIVGVEAI
ncbi:YolD-like family protein [Metabacillus schmidteae]|uniref:YolD-like family protein n=1 Tax=Metabacillus schmidteae TaxID=2730405 RepID=UPI00158987EF|nr:YolD-like family protein [Metabacillus schmidteae]